MGLKNTKVTLDDKGFVKINSHQETTDPNIMAIGDVAGGLMLAHKAAREARVAVEVLTGEASSFENVVIPAVVFTDPEIAWCGITEAEARAKGIEIKVTRFPWGASGRALATDKNQGYLCDAQPRGSGCALGSRDLDGIAPGPPDRRRSD